MFLFSMKSEVRKIVKIHNTFYISISPKWLKKHGLLDCPMAKVTYFKDFLSVKPIKVK